MSDPTAIYRRTWWLIAVGCVAPLLLPLTEVFPFDFIRLEGIALGIALSQATLAAAWAAFGPGLVSQRVPQSMLWAVIMGCSLGVGVAVLNNGRDDVAIFLLLTITQWLIALVPLIGLAIFLELQLRYQADRRVACPVKPRQFKIKHVMLFTALIAVLLGWGKLFLLHSAFGEGDELTFWSYMIVNQAVISLPVVVAALLPRNRWLVAIVLLWAGGVTLLEYLNTERLINVWLSNFLSQFCLWNNVTSVVWILVFITIVRRSGYHLGRPRLIEALESPAGERK